MGNRFSKKARLSVLITGVGAVGLDAIGSLQENVFPSMFSNFDDPKRLVANRQDLGADISETVGVDWHP
jgi:5-(hydroxymethyl)furfural/furfural oxidase